MSKENKKFMEDPRYKQCNKEAMYGIILGIINMVWWYAFGYGLGSKPVEEYTYILGFPAWFFYSCVLSVVIFVGATFFMVNKLYSCVLGMILVIIGTFFMVDKLFEEDMPLERMTEEEALEYERKHKGGRK